MMMPPMRFTVRRMMVAVAVVGGFLSLAVAFDDQWRSDLHHLRAGRRVVIASPRVTDPSGSAVPAGTPAVVVVDDRDRSGSTSGQREVLVTIFGGQSLKVRRDDLRPVKEDW